MPNSEVIQKKVIEALSKKLPDNTVCPLCKVSDWQVQIGVTHLPLQIEVGSTSSYSQKGLSNVDLICGNCGNTHLLNLRILLPELKGV
jgi:hypothetical protein